MSDIVERLRSHAESWGRDDCMDARDNEQEMLILEEAALEIERLRSLTKSAAQQCDNVIFNTEQKPASNERHLDNWRAVRDFLRSALPPPPERGDGQ